MNESQVEMVLKLGADLRAACEERDALRIANVRLLALARFGEWCLREARDVFGDLDGGSVQDKAESLGLLAEVTVTEPCGEECTCAEYYGGFPMKCLRYTDLAHLPVP
jgi:hypothetical protein